MVEMFEAWDSSDSMSSTRIPRRLMTSLSVDIRSPRRMSSSFLVCSHSGSGGIIRSFRILGRESLSSTEQSFSRPSSISCNAYIAE